jgi:flagellar basal-body rod modification protein FlgD
MSIAAAASTAASSTGTATNQNALESLSGNFQDFLGMLLTQLQNQDPTSPLDTNQFTSELVEFSGVEQQINTNSALTQLISLTQSGQLMQSTSMVGKTVQLSSSQMPLQNSSGSLTFTDPSAGTANITITNAAGTQVLAATVAASAGSNTWTWNGEDANGNTWPDGAYTVTVTSPTSSGTAAALPFTVSGTVTGVVDNSGTLDVQLGTESVPFSSVQSVSS